MNDLDEQEEQLAHQALELLELTFLHAEDRSERIALLCDRSYAAISRVAAICVRPPHVSLCRTTLDALGERRVKVVGAVNFSTGAASVDTMVMEAELALSSGSDEIDLMYPFHSLLAGDSRRGETLIRRCRDITLGKAGLTVSLGAGELRDPQLIRAACLAALEGGADFIKIAAGRVLTQDTPQAVRIMLEAVADGGGLVGIKVAGGMRTFAEARVYLRMVQERFGPWWLCPERVRLGTASLLDDLVNRLGLADRGQKKTRQEPGLKP